ncbi:MAG: hypothetical protein ACKVI3_09375 [Verrucomicrobiia bacterium]|tara:strand:+ start:2797 stop:3201 length:405 start_codon:yes stop_codon:yes gene_type:complete
MKKSASAFVSELMVYLLVLAGFNGSVWLGTVWMRHQISETAELTKQTERRLVAVERRLAETSARLASEQSPQTLESRNREMQLGLVRPAELHIVRIEESPEERLAAMRNFEIFSKEVITGDESVRFTLINPGAR